MNHSAFSVVILTLNEEANLPQCLDSIVGCDDILVLDSGSTDETCAIALARGARVLSNPFENFAQQRNYAATHGALRHPWVFHLDADEQFTPGLLNELRNWSEPDHIDGAWAAPQMIWRGTWLKRCTDYPAWQARFVHRDRFRFIEVGHGQREASDMRMTKLSHSYQHDLSAAGVDGWLEKHRHYAQIEARSFLHEPAPPLAHLVSPDALLRRRALKHLSYRFPFRPLLRLVYQYLLRGGFRDGGAAWEYCRLLAKYEGFAAKAIREHRSGLSA